MKKLVLLVEDDPWLRELYADTLRREEALTIFEAGTAQEALQLFNDHDIDLIVLDLFLPGHNGIEVLHELAVYGELAVPVILLTTVTPSDLAADNERLKHYGVVEYLYKPVVKPAGILTSVKKQLLKQGVH